MLGVVAKVLIYLLWSVNAMFLKDVLEDAWKKWGVSYSSTCSVQKEQCHSDPGVGGLLKEELLWAQKCSHRGKVGRMKNTSDGGPDRVEVPWFPFWVWWTARASSEKSDMSCLKFQVIALIFWVGEYKGLRNALRKLWPQDRVVAWAWMGAVETLRNGQFWMYMDWREGWQDLLLDCT